MASVLWPPQLLFHRSCCLARDRLYPPADLSYFDTPIAPAPFELHIGYASITWGGNDRQAIEDISSVGYPGIQVRSNAIKEFGSGRGFAGDAR